jgi:DNA polymerase III subunit gamma/tau
MWFFLDYDILNQIKIMGTVYGVAMNEQVHYQVSARKYRPKQFGEVLGQEPIVRTLKNALAHNRLAHAYLFCGSRGTGKTTLARIFAKALNCEHKNQDLEPCSLCASCIEIANGTSINVMEIDGASHRGIDDIRVITESVGYAPSKGSYKIYLIDEVHMLTKEAFNALLKTLEEPPQSVLFFFATTEPHKVPETILSRCQRFNLRRIPLPAIQKKLSFIAKDLQVEITDEALLRIAEFAAGGLRDAESIFDQIVAFSGGKVTPEIVQDVLGVMPREWFFELDKGFGQGDLAVAFKIAEAVFLHGKDIHHFLEDLATHYRHILQYKLTKQTPLDAFDPSYKKAIEVSAEYYSPEQCMTILEKILAAETCLKTAISQQMTLEALLLAIIRERHRIPIEFIARRLIELEKQLGSLPPQKTLAPQTKEPVELDLQPTMPEETIAPETIEQNQSAQHTAQESTQEAATEKVVPAEVTPQELSLQAEEATTRVEKQLVAEQEQQIPEREDPRLEILPVLEKKGTKNTKKPAIEKALAEVVKQTPPTPQSAEAKRDQQNEVAVNKEYLAQIDPEDVLRKKSRYDTLIQFAAVELDASVQKTDTRRK